MQRRNWDSYRFVLAACRLRTVIGVADALGVNESTVLRRLARVEGELGCRLFSRKGGELLPTDAGTLVVRHLECINDGFLALQDVVADSHGYVDGTVRITAVPMIINHVLIAATPILFKQYEHLQVELVADAMNLSIMKREADLAIRLSRPSSDHDALTRKLGDLDYGIFCHRDAVSSRDSLPWITHEPGTAELPQALWTRSLMSSDHSDAQLLVNDAESCLRSLLVGLGKSALARSLARLHPELIELDGYDGSVSREVWMLMHPAYKERRKVKVVAQWAEDTIRDFLVS